MKKYAVRITTQAQEQILKYAAYIKNELCNPVAEERFVRGIWKEMKTVENMPQRFMCLNDEPWKTLGVHRMIFKGYLVYYLINEEKTEVSVIGVVLGRQDQVSQLEQIKWE